tara:strand:- start:1010 stop:1828 length:819 start_codon:yes stop_codon:yes gene_type:complete
MSASKDAREIRQGLKRRLEKVSGVNTAEVSDSWKYSRGIDVKVYCTEEALNEVECVLGLYDIGDKFYTSGNHTFYGTENHIDITWILWEEVPEVAKKEYDPAKVTISFTTDEGIKEKRLTGGACTDKVMPQKIDTWKKVSNEEEALQVAEYFTKIRTPDLGTVEINSHIQLNHKEETKMTQQMNRRVRLVTLVDNSPSITAENSLVFSDESIFDGTNDELIRELIMGSKVSRAVAEHNELRTDTIDEEILNRVGTEVMLRPVKLKDLTWDVK